MQTLKRLLLATVLLAAAPGVAPVVAQDYPDHAVKVIVPHGAGGSTDLTTRLVAEPFAGNLGQSVAVVDVPGGGTSIGAQQAARAKPDGYTLAATHVALLTSSAMGVNKMGPESLTPVAQIGSETQIIAVPADSPIKTLKDFYEAAKTGADTKLKLGVSPGAANHFAFLRILKPIDYDVTFVPTGGGGPSMTSLLGNHIDVGTFVISESIDQIRAGKIRPIAVFAEERQPDLPDVPTAKEAGYDIDISLNYVWYAPKGTPQDRIDTLADAMEKTIADKNLQEKLLSRSIQPAFMRGDALEDILKERYQTIKQLASQVTSK